MWVGAQQLLGRLWRGDQSEKSGHGEGAETERLGEGLKEPIDFRLKMWFSEDLYGVFLDNE